MDPKISIVMPCHNGMPYLKEAVNSVLNQTYSDYYLCIINDHSDDGFEDYIRDVNDDRIKVYSNDGEKGVINTRNKAIELVETKYVALLDADDIMQKDRLRVELEYLEKHQEIGGVAGYLVEIDENGKEISECPKLNYYDGNTVKSKMFFNNIIANGSVMYRNKLVKDNKIRYRKGYGIEDYMFWCDFMNYAALEVLPYVFLYYRKVTSGLTMSNKFAVGRDKDYESIIIENFESNGFNLNKLFKNSFLRAMREDRPILYIDKLLGIYNRSELIKQARCKEYYPQFREECRKKFRINHLERIHDEDYM